MPDNTPPIGIRSIEITNFRSIDHLKLDFTDPQGNLSDLIVIAGPNGCGKTSVLEACLLMIGNESLRPTVESNLLSIRQRADSALIQIHTQDGPDQEPQLLLTRLKRGGVVSSSGFWGSKKHLLPSIYFSSWRSPSLPGPLSIGNIKTDDSNSDGQATRIKRIKQYFINLKAHSLMSSSGTENKNSFAKQMKQINDFWQKFYVYNIAEFVVDNVSDDPIFGFDIFLLESNGTKVPLDCLSSGQLELFGFFGELLLSKFTEGVIVIDEPELHLDPQWHSLVIRAIRHFLPKVQLIVATHSPAIYDMARSYQRFFLVPDNDPRAKAWNLPKNGVSVV